MSIRDKLISDPLGFGSAPLGNMFRNIPGAEAAATVDAAWQQGIRPMFDGKLTHAAWKSKPSWHVIATKDHTLSPAMEEAGAKKAGGKAISLPTCHVAMLQEPKKVADVIAEAANGAAKRPN